MKMLHVEVFKVEKIKETKTTALANQYLKSRENVIDGEMSVLFILLNDILKSFQCVCLEKANS